MGDDWDLHAVVRGCSTTTTTITTTTSSSFQPQAVVKENEKLFRFQDWLENTTIEELHELYKPFFPKTSTHTNTPLSPHSVPVSPLSVLGAVQDLSSQQQIVQQKEQPVQPPPRSSSPTTHTRCPRSKRRKNQMKRVCQVPAEGLSSDMWSWRKYGQKPIKGSPYPRGYYRCSTSKGCLARKQVERNRSDPSMLIVTYTGEHNHPMPTHRNSLAGSTRQKPATSGESNSNKPNSSQPSSPTASLSPVTMKLESSREEKGEIIEEEDDDDFGVADMPLDEDFFSGLADEFAGPGPSPGSGTDQGLAHNDCFSDHLIPTTEFPWLSNTATTTAGGGG